MGGGQHWKRRINVLELKSTKYAALTFTRRHPTENTYTNRKQSCPFLCSKNGTEEGGHRKQKPLLLWKYSLAWEIKITVGYCIEILQKQADYQSRTTNITCNLKSTRKARHRPLCIISISQSNKLQYMPRKLDPFSKGREELQFSWTQLQGYAFPSFSLI